MSTARDQQLASTFVALADTLVADFDVLDFLGLLTERAVDLLAVDAAGVILSDQRGGWRPAAGSSEHAHLVEVFAAQTRQGPCLDCVRGGVVVASWDLAEEAARWPAFGPVAVAAGFRAVCAVPMRLRDDVIGALTLLSAAPGPIDDASVALGQALADVATIGILQQRAIRHDAIVYEQLQAALHHRTVVEQAKGVVAEVTGLGMHESYTALREYSHAHRRRLSEVAAEIATGALSPAVLRDAASATSGTNRDAK
ncbi:GAF and ANTAR domain-containing protein [Actinokineospora globicatena]|uniref:GAF and ANTAR domain-containing protein n=1 Tax=Actinokineospora globicatena TaxID=103729 RepID=UPI0020A23A86|nr:GAF and ANTAR domain-containing protein [Actinokineospora globicatena]MCP2303795.1 GAF domain-containing protein [Actinokineospora globicatena]GLW79053.1 transcriptional regulator [Actinokineospora globicatena]GLW86537.1 transcriptional regulator [Actinokineospora globicatena]